MSELALASTNPSECLAAVAGDERRLALLYDLAHRVCREIDEGRVFDALLDAVAQLLRPQRAFIATDAGGRLVARSAYGIDLPKSPDEWPVSTTMLAKVLRERIGLLTSDAQADASFGKLPSVGEHHIRSVLCCPFGGGSAPRGVIYADNRTDKRAFLPPDLHFLTALAHFASVAAGNAADRRGIVAARELAEAKFEAARRDLPAEYEVIGTSQRMFDVFLQARKVAAREVAVLLVGETGTGKEVFARTIHSLSPRKAGPFIAVNLAALSAGVVESELFGHEKGAFTGADRKRAGRFELARGGTLFLDELQDAPAAFQPKLLRVLEQGVFEPVGSEKPVAADVRIVCACNLPPEKLVAENRLRADLYYRVGAIELTLPPLRERTEDVPLLVAHFLRRMQSAKAFAPEALRQMACYPWPGNVRELRNVVEAIDTLTDGPTVGPEDLPARVRAAVVAGVAPPGFEQLAALLARVEGDHIRRALDLAGGNNERAIKLLGMARATFYQRVRDLRLKD